MNPEPIKDDWDTKKAEELMKAMQACKVIEELNDLAKGIAFLPNTVLSEKSRAWLRTIYSSCKYSLAEPPFTTDHLNAEGKKAYEKERKDLL